MFLLLTITNQMGSEDTSLEDIISSLSSQEFSEEKIGAIRLERYAEKHPQEVVRNLPNVLEFLEKDPSKKSAQKVRGAIVTCGVRDSHQRVLHELVKHLLESDDESTWVNCAKILRKVYVPNTPGEDKTDQIIKILAQNESWVLYYPLSPVYIDPSYSDLMKETDPDKFFPLFEKRLERESELSLEDIWRLVQIHRSSSDKQRFASVVRPHIPDFEDIKCYERKWAVSLLLSHLPEGDSSVEWEELYSILERTIFEIDRLEESIPTVEDEILVDLSVSLRGLGREYVNRFEESWGDDPNDSIRQTVEFVLDETKRGVWTESKLMAVPPLRFEKLVADLWEDMGYETYVTRESGDRGVDVVAEGDKKVVIQAKRYSPDRRIGVRKTQRTVGVIEEKDADIGVIVTTSEFTEEAELTGEKVTNLRLVEGEELLEMLTESDIQPYDYIKSDNE